MCPRTGFTDISFTTPGADLPRAKETMERIVPEIGAREFIVDEDIAKVSLVGTGMKSSPGVASRTFQTLGDNNINIVAISTSPIRLSMIVDAAQSSTGRPVPAHRLRARFRRRVRGNPAFSRKRSPPK
ncbi:MAG: ACT domain-containing protein [Adlercreutzia equolifaciens]